jgi:hypothetical protein
MKSARVCLLSLVCVCGAFAFGLVANAAIDLVIPAPGQATAKVAKPAGEARPVSYALASTTSTPVDLAPIKVKTIPLLYREERTEAAAPEGVAAPLVAVPLPRPRPASAPALALASTESLAHQPGSLAISAATRKGAPDDGEVLGAAGIERMRLALALTAEQEEYWPSIAAELLAVGKLMKANQQANHGKISVDNDTMQRLYWAAAPLLTRLSYEQKTKVKQMARLMGLNQVAEAL